LARHAGQSGECVHRVHSGSMGLALGAGSSAICTPIHIMLCKESLVIHRRLSLAVILSLACTPAFAQAPAASSKPAASKTSAKAYTPPRTPWGDPDFQGNYTNVYESGTPLERPERFAGRKLDEVKGEELAAIKRDGQDQTIKRFQTPFDA